jgi:serine/threonine-protein kinase HipA
MKDLSAAKITVPVKISPIAITSKNLTVKLAGQRAGMLWDTPEGALQFQYSADYIKRPNSYPLSLSMPLSEASYSGAVVSNFFANLLPDDSETRDMIGNILGISANNIFGMIQNLGRDLPGAVTVSSDDQDNTQSNEPHEQLTLLETTDIENLYEKLEQQPFLLNPKGQVRHSVAGFQPKLGIRIVDKKFFIVGGDIPTSHIIKPEPPKWPGLAINEYFCLATAGMAGLPIAKPFPVLGRRSAIVSARFDRIIDPENPEQLLKLHQEDFCQALGLPPSKKYQSEGGPTIEDCARVIAQTSSPVENLLKFFDYLVFHYLVGNTDAHAKNYALIYTDGPKPELAPLYDVISVEMYRMFQGQKVDRKSAMKLGKRRLFSQVYPRHWKVVATQLGLSPTQALKRARALAERVKQASSMLLVKLVLERQVNPDLISRIKNLIESRANQLLGSDPITPDVDEDDDTE